MPISLSEVPARCLATLCATCFVATCLAGQEAQTTPSPAELQRLLRDLASTDYAVREAATRHLLALGENAREVLQGVRAALPLEAQLRVEAILDLLEGPRRQVAQRFEPTLVDVDLDGVPLSEAVRRLGAAAGCTVRLVRRRSGPPGATMAANPGTESHERPVSLKVVQVPFFQALDLACERWGLFLTRDHQTGDLLLNEGSTVPPGLVVYFGPLRVALTSVAITRQTRFSEGPFTTANLQVRVDVENSVEVLGLIHPLQVPPAHDDQGRTVTFPNQRTGNLFLLQMDKRRQAHLGVSMDPPEKDATHLRTLRIPLELVVPEETMAAEIPWPLERGRADITGGPLDLHLDLVRDEHGETQATLSFVAPALEGTPSLQNFPPVDEIQILDREGAKVAFPRPSSSRSEGREVRTFQIPTGEISALRLSCLARYRVERIEVVFESVPLP